MKIPLFCTALLLATLPTAWSQCGSDADCDGIEGGIEGFCGKNSTCYEFSCQNWLQYGPEQFTGLSANSTETPELTCSDYDSGESDNANSIVFGCRPYSPGKIAPKAKTATFFFNQKCTASPGGGLKYECYQNKAGTDYNSYLGDVAREQQNIPNCDTESGITDNPLPIYWFIKEARREGKDGSTIAAYGQGRELTENAESFDPSEAAKTMFATLVTDESGGSGGEESGGEGGSSAGGRASLWVVAAGALMLNMIVL